LLPTGLLRLFAIYWFAADRQIDRLVYDLYGLTEEVIAGVKGKERSKLP
jgi:hypothetical protein